MGRIDWLQGLRFRVGSGERRKRALRRQKRKELKSKLSGHPAVEVFEPRILLTTDSLLNQTLPAGDQPVDVETGFADVNASLDAVVLNSDGSLTVASNGDDGTWSSVSSVDLGVGPANGLAAGFFDADTSVDVAIQTPDGVTFATGDGLSGFSVSDSWTAPVAGSLATPAGQRSGITTGLLDDDFFADVVTVAPGSDEVIVFTGNGSGTFDAPFITSTGGDEPVAVGVGNVIGNVFPDLVIGHTDGTLSLLEGHGDGTFTLRNDLTVTGLGAVTDLAVEDLNGDGELDILVTTPTSVSLLTNDVDALTASPIVNGRFDQGLTGWNQEIVGHPESGTAGRINGLNGFAQFTENDSFLTSLNQTFEVPDGPQEITVDLLTLGLDDPQGGIPDAFEISLLDTGGNSLVNTHSPLATSFFNVNPGGAVSTASGVSFDGTTVTLDISALVAGTSATLYFDLVGNPPGDSSVVVIDNVRITPDTIYTETFSVTSLSGPFSNATSVETGDVDGDGLLDIVVADAGADVVAVFNGTVGGGFVRDDIDVNSFGETPLTLTLAPITPGDSIDDILVTLFDSDRLLTPLQFDVTPPEVTLTNPLEGQTTTAAVSDLTVQFSEAMLDDGPTALHSVTNPAAYSLIHFGPNGVFEGGTGDDVTVAIDSVAYDGVTFAATLVVAAAESPLADGQYQLTVAGSSPGFSLRDIAGNTLGDGTDAVFEFNVDHRAGEVTSLSAVAGNEGQSVSLSGSFVDPGSAGPHAATIDWGDGSLSSAVVTFANGAGTIDASHVYANDGSYTVQVDLASPQGNDTDSTSAIISNVAPTLDVAADQSVLEGAAVSGTIATFSDPGFSDPVAGTTESFTATIDWGDGTIEAGTVSVSNGAEGTPTTGSVDGSHVYADDGIFTVTVSVTDNGSASDSTAFQVTVQNVAPNVSVQDVSAVEGGTVNLSESFTDPGADTFTATIDWGDGTTTPGTVTFVDGNGTVTASHVYADNGDYPVTVTLTDDDGGIGTDSATATILNSTPTISGFGNQSTTEGAAISGVLANFADAGFSSALAGTVETFTATIDWGDGTVEAGTVSVTQGSAGVLTTGSVSGSHSYADEGTYTATITVSDDDGASVSHSFDVAVSNVAPSVTAADLSGAENANVSFMAAFTDPGIDDVHTATIDWGDGTTTTGTVSFAGGTGAVSGSHMYADDGIYTIVVTVDDGDGGVSSDTATATISNVAPSITGPHVLSATEGDTVALFDVEFTDPAGSSETFTATIDWGDGTVEAGIITLTGGATSSGTIDGSHTYVDDGTYVITVTVTDDDGGSASHALCAEIANAAPVVSVASGTADEGSSTSLAATFTDVGIADSHTALIDWGDGTIESGVVTFTGGAGTVSGTHTYADNGTYSVSVTVTDDDNAAHTSSADTVVSNVAPTVGGPGNQSINEGDTLSLDVATFSDPGFTSLSAGTSETFTATVDWGDGTVEAGTVSVVDGQVGISTDGTVAGSHTYSNDGTFTVVVTVSDDDGGSNAHQFDVDVANVVPVVTVNALAADEGSTVTATASFTDPGDDVHSAVIDWGDGSTSVGAVTFASGIGTVSGSHTYADNSDYTVTVTVADDDASGAGSAIAAISNVDPVVSGPGNQMVSEGSELNLTLADFVDPGFSSATAGTTESFAVTIDWGDGTVEAGSVNVTNGSVGVLTTGNVDGSHTYENDGVYNVVVTVSDDDGGSGTHTFDVTVTNVAPVVAAADVVADEGQNIDFTATFTDPGTADVHTATINWGDGTSSSGVVTFSGGAGTVSASHTYADNGEYFVTVTVVDEASGAGSDNVSASIANVAPTLSVIGDQTISEGVSLSATLGTFSDPGFTSPSAGTVETFTATIDWGDGSAVEAGVVSVTDGSVGVLTAGTIDGSHTYADDGTFTVTVSVSDDDGGSSTQTFNVTVENALPVVTTSDLSANEGDPVSLTVDFADLGQVDTHVAIIDWGDNQTSTGTVTFVDGVGTVTADHTYADNAAYTVTVTVTDDDGGAGSDNATATIDNVAPSVTASADQSLIANLPHTLTVADFTDPGFTNLAAGTVETFTTTIDWGDGSPVEAGTVTATPGGPGTLTVGSVDGTHVWSTLGTHTVTVTVTDDDGGSQSASFVVDVFNPAPTFDSVTAPFGSEGSSVNLAATFSDPGDQGPHVANIDWGDGSVSTGVVSFANGAGTISADHIYADDTEYLITLSLTDEVGNLSTIQVNTVIDGVSPTVVPAATQTVLHHQPLTLTVGSFSDPGFTNVAAGTAETFTATIDWGDGSPVEAGSVTFTAGSPGVLTTGSVDGSHTWTTPGTYTVRTIVTDDDGDFGTATFDVVVVNEAPDVDNVSTVNGSEGTAVSVSATFTDEFDPGPHSASIDWGDGSVTSGFVTFAGGSGSVTGSHTYADNGIYNIEVTVTDDFNDAGSATGTASISNVTPTLSLVSDLLLVAGSSTAVTLGTFADPGFTNATAGTVETFSATIDWGDGTVTSGTVDVVQGAAGTFTTGTISGTHSYGSVGDFTVTVTLTDDDGGVATGSFTATTRAKFFVVDQSAHESFLYTPGFNDLGSFDLASGNPSPRGATTNPAGDTLWVVNTNRNVFVYDVDGTLRGSWQAKDAKQPEGVATDGTDVWIVGDSKDKVYYYAGAASRLSGNINSTSSFNLHSQNKKPSGIVSDGTTIWVTDEHSNKERVFVYDTSGTFLGQWNLDSANGDPSGITIDPSTGDLYVSDRHDGKVYQYAGATTRTSGSQSADAVFDLNSANHNPEGIADPVGTMNIGDTIADAISVPGEVDEWQFTATAGQQIYFDFQAVSDFLISTLQTPSGSSFNFTFGYSGNDLDQGPFTIPVSGTWTMRLESDGVLTPSYQFQTFDVSAPDTVVLPLTPAGAVGDGAIELPGSLDHWQFDVTTAGTDIFIDWSQPSGGTGGYRLLTPSGSVFQQNFSATPDPLDAEGVITLNSVGTWTIEVLGAGGATPDYLFTLYEVPPPVPVAIPVDTVINGAIDTPGQVDQFEFTVGPNVSVEFDWLTLTGTAPTDQLIVQLFDPSDTQIRIDVGTTASQLDTGVIDLVDGGTYRLDVDGRFDNTFTYSFSYSVIDTSPVVRSLNIGDIGAATLAAVDKEDHWEFSAVAGQDLFVDWQALDTGFLAWELYAPDDSLVTSATDILVNGLDDGPVDLPLTGTYRLEISSNAISTYQFQLFDVPAPDVFSLGFGELAAGAVESPGRHDEWIFSGTTGQEVFLDWQAIDGRFLVVDLLSPSGGLLLHDAGLIVQDLDNGPLVLNETGNYTLKVSGLNSDTGTYEFRVFDVTPVAPIAIPFDTVISGAIDTPGRYPIYTFNGTSGQDIVLDWVSNPSNVFGEFFEFTLTDPSGSTVITDVTTDQPLTLSATGEYTLTVQPANAHGSDRTGTFAFRVVDGSIVPPLPPASDLVVTTVSAPQRVIGDPASVTVSWTVTNNSANATDVSDWVDRVYFSVDGEFQRSRDSVAAEVAHSGVLAPGASYSESAVIALPAGFEGDVSIFVETDSLNEVFEEPTGSPTGEENNVAFAATTSVFKEQLEAGPPAIDLDIADGELFPTGSTISLSGQASVIPGTTNVIFALDVSGSTSSVVGLDANFDGVVDSADDLNGDGSVGDILDTEIGAVQRVVQNLRDNEINASVAVVLFGTFSETMDLGPQFYNQTFVDPNADEDGDGVFDIDQAVTSIQQGGADLFRPMTLATGTSFSEAILQVNSAAGRTLDAELTQVLFLTDGSSAQPPLADVEELASYGVDFHGFQITGTSVSSGLQFIADTVDAESGSTGTTTIVEDPRDLGRALLGALDIAGVMVNNAGVQSLDALGRFFTPVTIASGSNVFTVEAIDSDGRSSFRTVTLEGVDPGATSFDTLQDVSTQASVSFTNTTFNRLTRQLHADATLTADIIALDSPVLAQFDPSADSTIEFVSTTGQVALDSPDGTNPDTDAPYVSFDSEIPAGSLNVGESSVLMPLSFPNGDQQRFGFEITILGSGNAAPFFSSAPRTQATEGVEYTSIVEVTDPDGHDVTVEILTGPAGLTLDSQPSSLSLVWTPTATQSGLHEVVLRATDGRGGSALQTFTIDVSDSLPNRPPVFQTAPPTQIDSGTNFNYVPEVFDLDGDTITFSLPTAPAGTVFNASTGEITLTTPVDGSYDFELIADDGNGGTASQEFTLTVGAGSTNDGAPVIFSTPPTVAAIDELYLYLPFAQDPDGDPLTFSLAAAPAGMTIDPASGRIDWTPTAGQLGLNGVLLRVDDGQGHAATQFFNVLVLTEAPNRAPVFLSQPDLFATQDETFSYNPLAIDPEGFAVTYALVSGPAGATFDPVLSTLNYLPSTPDLGVQTFEISATDPEGEASFQRFTIDVRGPNTAPTFTSTPIETTIAGTTYRYNADATDTEDNVTFSLVAGPTGSTIDPVTGVVTWTPALADIITSPHSVTVRATDDRGLFTDQPYDLTVNADTEAPVVSIRLSDNNVNPGTPVTITVAAMDNVDVSSLTVTINGTPVTLVGGQTTFTPPTPGLNNITATATDSAGNQGTATTTLRALDPTDNTAPVIDITSPSPDDVVTYLTDIIGSITDDNLTEYEVAVSRVFSDQWTTTFSQTFPNADGNLNNELIAVFDPTLLQNGVYDIRVSATDVSFNTAEAIVTVSVEGNAKIGVNHQSTVDLMIPVAGGPAIEIHRGNSQMTSDLSGDFGNGWQFCTTEPNLVESVARSEFEGLLGQFVALPFQAGDRVYITTPDCQRVGFTFSPVQHTGIWSLISSDFYEPRWIADPGVDWELYGEYDLQTLTGPTTSEFDLDGLPLPLLQTSDGFIVGQITASYNPLGYQLINKQGVRYHYDQYDGLTEVADRNGNTLSFDEAGITSSSGQQVQFLRDVQGRITAVIDPAGHQIDYTYDSYGNLIDVSYPNGLSNNYSYTPESYLAAVNPDNQLDQQMISTGFEYDVAGRLGASISALGARSEFSYNLDDNTRVVVDALGNSTTVEYDDRGNVVREISPLGGEVRMTIDENDNVTSITDERGFVTEMTYDDRRNLLTMTDPFGFTTEQTFNEFNQQTSQTDSLGNVYTYWYDDRGNLTSLSSPLNSNISTTYDNEGRPVSMTDTLGRTQTLEYGQGLNPTTVTYADGAILRMTYNVRGQLTSLIDENGGLRTFAYDPMGRMTQLNDTLGQSVTFTYAGRTLTSVTNKRGQTTQYAYDVENRLIRVTDPLGGVQRFTYNALGQNTTRIDELGRTTTLAYDANRRLEAVTNAAGGVTRYEYDLAGNLTALIDPNLNRTEQEYDARNYLISQSDPLGNTWGYTYDAVGNQIELVDPRGNITTSQFDDLQRLTTVTDALGNDIGYLYDTQGNLLAVTDQAGRTTTEFSYDVRNRVSTRTDAAGFTQSFVYDPSGNRTSVTDELGRTVSFTYDELNRVVTATDASSATWTYEYNEIDQRTRMTDPLGNSTQYMFDELNRPISSTGPEGDVTSHTYDAVGNRTATTDALGQVTSYSYDSLNRMVSETNALGFSTDYEYDLVGNLTAVLDANGNRTQFIVDATNRVTERIDPLGNSTLTEYDQNGNVTRITDRNGRIRQFTYDVLDRLSNEVWFDSDGQIANEIDVTFDDVGNLTAMQDYWSNATFAYDVIDRLTISDTSGTAGLPDTVLNYSYDAAGNQLSTTDNAGTSVQSSYGERNQLESRQWASNGQELGRVDFTYNDRGERTETVRYSSFDTVDRIGRTSFTYSADGVIESIAHADAVDTVFSNFDYTRDVLNRIESWSHHGETTQYTHDSTNQLATADHSTITDESYTYDALGNRIGTGISIGTNNQLLADNTFDYGYDDEGNVISKTERSTGTVISYQYDQRNRLVGVQVTSSGGAVLVTASYIYDAFNRRILKSVDADGDGPGGSETIATVYDREHAWADYDATGTVTTRYLFGDRTDEIIARWRSTEGTVWYLTDHLGTVHDLIDSTGTVVNRLTYDSFGNILNQTAPSYGDRFAFTGREYDAESGLYYYRARYYDPAIGRFQSLDPIGFEAGDANLYRYVGNHVLSSTDPSGNAALVEWAVTVSIDTYINVSCELLELEHDGAFDNPSEHAFAIAGQVGTALAVSAVGAVLGSGLAFKVTLNAFKVKIAVTALAVTGGVGLQAWSLYSAYSAGAADGDFYKFKLRWFCLGANLLTIPVAAGIPSTARAAAGLLRGLGPDVASGFAIFARKGLRTITGAEYPELLKDIIDAKKIRQILEFSEDSLKTLEPLVRQQLGVNGPIGTVTGHEAQKAILDFAASLGIRATKERPISLPKDLKMSSPIVREGLQNNVIADVFLPDHDLVIELTLRYVGNLAKLELRKSGQLSGYFFGGFRSVFVDPH